MNLFILGRKSDMWTFPGGIGGIQTSADQARNEIVVEWQPSQQLQAGLYVARARIAVSGVSRYRAAIEVESPFVPFIVTYPILSVSVPAEVQAGGTYPIRVTTHAGVERVVVALPTPNTNGAQIVLSRTGDGEFEGSWDVHERLASGVYTVRIRASDYFGWTEERTVTVRVSGSAPQASLEEVCEYLVNPAWARPNTPVALGCRVVNPSETEVVSAQAVVNGTAIPLSESPAGTWQATIDAPAREGVYEVQYEVLVRKPGTTTVPQTLRGEQLLIVSESNGVGFCTPEQGMSVSEFGKTGKVRLTR